MAATVDESTVEIWNLGPVLSAYPKAKPVTRLGTPAFGRRLRFALAMKGGISLAVWIGGAVAELDVLRRVRIVGTPQAPVAHFLADRGGATTEVVRTRALEYARVLASRGYDQVEFDVLAGASAGGLNAVLYGVAQRAGVAVDSVLDTWVKAGSIWELLRPPGIRGVQSALRGDAYFWPEVRAAIERLYEHPVNVLHQTPRLTMDLSATVIDHDDPSAMGRGERGGHFRFVGLPKVVKNPKGSKRSTAPTDEELVRLTRTAREDHGRSVPATYNKFDAARLAYAARTTSSFPGAFEPARIWSHPTCRPPARDGTVDMSFAFHAHRPGPVTTTGDGSRRPDDSLARPFRAIDGGVVDNIPIDRAFRAVRDMPADDVVNRAILYLEPDPSGGRRTRPSGALPAPRLDRLRFRAKEAITSFFTTAKNGIVLRGIRESDVDEIAEVERHKRELLAAQGRDQSFAQVVKAAPGLTSTRLQDGYFAFRATNDLELLTRVLSDPSLWQLSTTLATRAVQRSVPREVIADLERVLVPVYGTAQMDDGVISGSQALVEATRAAIAWIRKIEDRAFAADLLSNLDATEAGRFGRTEIRRRLMTIAAVARHQRDLTFDAMLAKIDGRAVTTSDAKVPLTAEGICDAWCKAETETATRLGPAWDELDVLVEQLRGLAEVLRSGLDAKGRAVWRKSPWAHYRARLAGRDLAPFAASRGNFDALNAIRFATITGDERPALTTFSGLLEARRAGVAENWLSLRSREFTPTIAAARAADAIPSGLDAGSKLAGSELGNFGAFLSADWRRNDWWWGRLDAGAGIVRFLGGLLPHHGPAGAILEVDATSQADDRVEKDDRVEDDRVEKIAALVQTSILRQADGDRDRPYPRRVEEGHEDPDTARAARMTAGAHRIGDLPPAYTLGIFSRLTRVVVRGLGSGWSPAAFAARVFLPPLLVLAPLAVHPWRAVAGLFATLAAVAVIWSAPGAIREPSLVPTPWLWPSICLVIGVGVLLFASFRVIDGYWRRHHLAAVPEFSEVLERRGAWAEVWSTSALVAGVLAFILATRLHAEAGGLTVPFWIAFGVGLVMLLIASHLSRKLPTAPRHLLRKLFWVGVALGAIWVGLNAEAVRDVLIDGPATWWANAANLLPPECWPAYLVDEPEDALIPAVLGVLGGAWAFILGWGWVGGLWSVRWPFKNPRGRVVRFLWSVFVGALGLGSLIATMALCSVACALIASAALGFGGNDVLTPAVTIGVITAFVGAHVFWLATENPLLRLWVAKDRPIFDRTESR